VVDGARFRRRGCGMKERKIAGPWSLRIHRTGFGNYGVSTRVVASSLGHVVEALFFFLEMGWAVFNAAGLRCSIWSPSSEVLYDFHFFFLEKFVLYLKFGNSWFLVSCEANFGTETVFRIFVLSTFFLSPLLQFGKFQSKYLNVKTLIDIYLINLVCFPLTIYFLILVQSLQL
jgi:hypothetical protein